MTPEGMNIRTFPVHAAADSQIDGAADAPPNIQANTDRTGPTVSLVGFGANFGATMDGHDVHRTSSVRHRGS